jgi:anaerobic ribonucleoside-triphosphate reductase
MIKRQPCEIYSRVVGFIRPLRQWNKGKATEFKDREVFKWKKAIEEKRK